MYSLSLAFFQSQSYDLLIIVIDDFLNGSALAVNDHIAQVICDIRIRQTGSS